MDVSSSPVSPGPTPTPAPSGGRPPAAPTAPPGQRDRLQLTARPKQVPDGDEDDGVSLRDQVTNAANWGFRAAAAPPVLQGAAMATRLANRTRSATPVGDALKQLPARVAAERPGGRAALKAASWLEGKPQLLSNANRAGVKVARLGRNTLGKAGTWLQDTRVARAGSALAEARPWIRTALRGAPTVLGGVASVAGLAVAGADCYVAAKVVSNPKASGKEKGLAIATAGLQTVSAVTGAAMMFGAPLPIMLPLSIGTGFLAGFLDGKREALTRQRTGNRPH